MFDRHAVIKKLSPSFGSRASEYDATDGFVRENFADLKAERAFSAAIPAELGGGGLPHSEMCQFIREMARECASTALAFSMHQHLIAANVFNHRRGNPGEKLLRKVVDGELVLVSTGATDWLSSTGVMVPCDGGFRLTASKRFASGSPAGDILITTGRYEDAKEGWQVLHFPLSMKTEGVQVGNDWKTLGMRGTGSHTIVIKDAFVPAEAVGLRRPMGKYHGVWNVVLGVAMPLIGAAYVGAAEAAASIARESAAQRGDDGLTPLLLGEMENELTSAQLAQDSIVAMANDLDFEPSLKNSNAVLIRRTLLGQGAIRTVSKAMEIAAGSGFYRSSALERIFRDVQASQYHPLPLKKQQRFTGRVGMGLSVDEALDSIH